MSTVASTSLDQAATWSTKHPFSAADKKAMTGLRAMVEPNKGRLQGILARGPYDAIMERVRVPAGVIFRPDTVGGISGWWCKPENAKPGKVIVHLHGGWFNWGSAQAFRNLIGHIAARAGVEAFIPDYRLAPEHAFPAATEDVQACYLGLRELGFTKAAITGDSAGGNLALVLLLFASTQQSDLLAVGAVALSPVTDLALTGASWETRAAADPYFIRSQAESLVAAYLNGHDPLDPAASPLYADLSGLPPLRVLVGEDEVLLDDSVRFAERAIAAGVDARLDIWEGMAHGFLSGFGMLEASTQTLEVIGSFLDERFATSTK